MRVNLYLNDVVEPEKTKIDKTLIRISFMNCSPGIWLWFRYWQRIFLLSVITLPLSICIVNTGLVLMTKKLILRLLWLKLQVVTLVITIVSQIMMKSFETSTCTPKIFWTYHLLSRQQWPNKTKSKLWNFL